MGPTASDTCVDQYGAQIGLRVIDILTDVVLSALPAVMVAGVQMSTYKRLVVGFMFGLRIITPAFTAVTLARLNGFYDTPTADRPFAVVIPSIWTTVALNASLITATLPSIKRFLTDWAAGVANAGLVAPFELQESTGQSYGARSISRSRHRFNNLAKGNPGNISNVSYSGYVRSGRNDQGPVIDDGDSKKGLTDGIMQTTDYHIEFESIGTDGRRQRSPEG